jgi:hypothetical protein
MPSVDHVRPDLEADRHIGGTGAANNAQRIIEQWLPQKEIGPSGIQSGRVDNQ